MEKEGLMIGLQINNDLCTSVGIAFNLAGTVYKTNPFFDTVQSNARVIIFINRIYIEPYPVISNTD